MKENAKNNAVVTATKENGFVHLSLTIEGCENISIKVNDFGGTQKEKAKKLSYKVYKLLGGK